MRASVRGSLAHLPHLKLQLDEVVPLQTAEAACDLRGARAALAENVGLREPGGFELPDRGVLESFGDDVRCAG